MFKFLIRTTFFLFLFLIVEETQAQIYNFSNYTVETGLSQGQILSVFQNDDGVMWFGTNAGGITKYDGNSYEYITDKDGLADNIVYSIIKDKKGNILIGTNNGLSVFNGKYFKNYTTKNGLSHNRVFNIFFDSKGRTLLATGKGITVFKDSICTPLDLEGNLNNSSVFNIYEDSQQNLWFSTIENGAFKYDGKIIKNYTTKEGLRDNNVYSVLEYKNNNYWFLTIQGLSQLTNKEIKSISLNNLVNDVACYSGLKDKNDNIWLACNKGVIEYDEKNVQLFTPKNGLVSNNIWKIFQDKESNLWFASRENGISKLASKRFLKYTTNDGLPFNIIKRIYQSKDGRYWIGSKKGLCMYDGQKFTNYTQKDLGENIEITAITEDNRGNIVIGTDYGVLIYDGKKFKRIVGTDNNTLNGILDVFINNKGETWLGTKGGIAQIIDGSIREFVLGDISKSLVYKIYQDEKKNYWFAKDDGLYKFDGVHVTYFNKKNGFIKSRVSNIVSDSANNLWFATSSGLFKYSKNEFSRITQKEGLSSDIVQSLVIDKHGNVWAGLPNGLDKISFKKNGTYEINHYQSEDGFTGEECVLNSILIDKQDKIWIGTQKGLMVYQSQFDSKNNLEPITRIKSINLFSQKTDWKLYAHSLDSNDLPVNLELAHDRNYLTFNFIGVSLTTPTKVRYKYMVKGIDKDWIETSKTEAVYSNIPSGKYEFLVIANNGEGVWNKVPVSFKFKIHPPFWQTWWFYSIIVLIILIFIYSYIKIRTANTKILKQSEIIEEKNADLKHANWEIAGKNKSITDSINYALRIQQSFLTSEKLLSHCLTDYFILFKPRDIVSGDFYWAFELPDRTLIACADSTGHGIPGAFMSLIGISLLNEISHSKEIIEPGKMLDELRRIIICALNPEGIESGGKDGMDISLLSIFKSDTDEVRIHFSGANNATYHVSVHSGVKDLIEFKGDKQPVGYYSAMKPFSQKEITVMKGDIIYLFTDGFADQFGGPKGKKFMSKQLKRKLYSIYNLPLKEQKQLLEQTFQDWKGELDQVDDITVIGIKI